MLDFLTPFWRDAGLHCLVSIYDGKVKHYWSDEYPDLAPVIARYKEEGRNLYWAMSSYSRRERKQDFVQAVPAFWLDIDAGPKKPYPDRQTALDALERFVMDTGLPQPTHIVGSGLYGLHVYWLLDNSPLPAVWVPLARTLQTLCQQYEFHVDSKRTSDSASILRIPGTLNWKVVESPEPVVILRADLNPVSLGAFATKLRKFALPVPSKRTPGQNLAAAQDEFDVSQILRRQVSAHDIAERCGQIARVRDRRGDVSEPLWYDALSILRLTTEAPGICHEWSNGHPGYSEAETDRKIAQLTEKDIGAVLCETLMRDSDMPDLCTLCPSRTKVRTPFSLARIADKVLTQEIGMPAPFVLDATGRLVYQEGPDAPEEVLFPYPLRIIARMNDGDQHSILIEVDMPKDGTQEIDLPLATIYARSQLFERLAGHGILIAPKYLDLMRLFFILRTQQMQESDDLRSVSHHMGWQDDGAFLLGRDRIYAHETKTGVSTGEVRRTAKSFAPHGDASQWGVVLDHYAKAPPAWQFAFLAGLGAPLMRFAGYAGTVVSLTGLTGTGKSTLQRSVMSAYGNPTRLIAQQTDTTKSLMHRMGQYHSVPVCVDEMTNVVPADLSDLIYQVTQGAERSRLVIQNSRVVMGETAQWRTVVLLSTNHPVLTKLSMAKTDSRAEAMRVWEMHMGRYGETDDMTQVNQTVMKHYGHFGRRFVPFVARAGAPLTESVESRVSAWGWEQEERYWKTAATLVMTTAVILKGMQAADFDQRALKEYILHHRSALRGHIERLQRTSVDQVLGAFFQSHSLDGIKVTKDRLDGLSLPKSGKMAYRYEAFHDRLYIDRRIFMQFLSQNAFGGWQEIYESWQLRGLVPRLDTYNLFKGTPIPNTPVEVLVLTVPKDSIYAVGGTGVLDDGAVLGAQI